MHQLGLTRKKISLIATGLNDFYIDEKSYSLTDRHW